MGICISYEGFKWEAKEMTNEQARDIFKQQQKIVLNLVLRGSARGDFEAVKRGLSRQKLEDVDPFFARMLKKYYEEIVNEREILIDLLLEITELSPMQLSMHLREKMKERKMEHGE